MDLSPKAILRIAKDYGWELKRVTGSHHIYKNPTTGKSVPIPIHGNKDLKLGTFKSIEKILKEND